MPRYPKSLIPLVFALLVLVSAACSSQPAQEPPGNQKAAEAPTVPEGTLRTAAFSGVKKAEEVAAEWREDAELYAVASPAPQVDAEGRSPGWLYTYVSKSAGVVASVTVAGEKAKLAPEQELPEDQIRDISKNLLPSPEQLKDSSEAIQEAGEVREVLESDKEAKATAGLDSFSSGGPVWIFSAAQGDERVEQKIPADS